MTAMSKADVPVCHYIRREVDYPSTVHVLGWWVIQVDLLQSPKSGRAGITLSSGSHKGGVMQIRTTPEENHAQIVR